MAGERSRMMNRTKLLRDFAFAWDFLVAPKAAPYAAVRSIIPFFRDWDNLSSVRTITRAHRLNESPRDITAVCRISLYGPTPFSSGFPSSGVYFLLRGYEVIYIGKSRRVRRRVSQHRSTLPEKFDSWRWIPCVDEMLLGTERLLIKALSPRLNGSPHNRWAQSAGGADNGEQ